MLMADFATPVEDAPSGGMKKEVRKRRIAFGATPVERIASVLLFTDHHGGAVCVARDDQEAFWIFSIFVLCDPCRTGALSTVVSENCCFLQNFGRVAPE